MAKILFFLEDYNYFYTNGSLELFSQKKKYDEVLSKLIGQKHYQSDSMANAFNQMGHETKIVVPEANPLQLNWAKENSKKLYVKWLLERPLRSYKSRVKKQHRTSYNSIQFLVLIEQVKKFNPDIIYIYSNICFTENQISKLKKYCKKVVLQWTCPIWTEQPNFPYWAFDLIITAAIQLKEYFEKKNYPCIYLQQAFDDRILEELEPIQTQKKGDLIFIGSFSLGHNYRFEVLENLLKNKVDLTVYGAGSENLPATSLVRKSIQQPLYGIKMYNELRKYKMALHINTTGVEGDGLEWSKYAGAKRLFEITGSGTLLLTSMQDNIKDLFLIDKEVVVFNDSDDLLQKIYLLLNDSNKIDHIASSGMKRTLKEHTFFERAREIAPVLFNN